VGALAKRSTSQAGGLLLQERMILCPVLLALEPLHEALQPRIVTLLSTHPGQPGLPFRRLPLTVSSPSASPTPTRRLRVGPQSTTCTATGTIPTRRPSRSGSPRRAPQGPAGHERLRSGGLRRLPHLLGLSPRRGRPVGHVAVARPRPQGTQHPPQVASSPRRVRRWDKGG
jgi:hypothetical protein